ncbi:hypothetical protein EOI86_16420 [Hwanghaeella grinnelliae]|uniref:DUF7033 domain-containing protein n=1 Tax=Hwanghaeella grinnelliae TaxID=2500179 RepID=A0A3S2Z7Z7_9PROT|nr:hypothetical protein [Hwanghaeella grinnelliae]RVU36749.1 hypothetical protein EOI86_16420 [Hwanghaeella grinnelliae]
MTEKRSIRLSTAPELQAFRPELDHVCRFLEAMFPLRFDDGAEVALHYGADAPDDAILTIPAVAFPACVTIGDKGDLLPNRKALEDLTAMETGTTPLFPPAGETSAIEARLPYDAIGSIFVLISRLEEYGAETGDRYGRYTIEADLVARCGRYGEALADRAAWDIAAALLNGTPEYTTRYDVIPTHDIDSLKGYHSVHEPLRWAMGDLIKRRSLSKAANRLREGYFSGAPWRSIEDLMAASENHGLKSRFYFMGPTLDPMDAPYAAKYPKLTGKVIRRIRQGGHRLGYHPGFQTWDDEEEWARQRRDLEALAGVPVLEGRQHVLHYKTGVTAEIWDRMGMDLDLTLGYPEKSGFRTGSAHAVPAYSLRQRKTLSLRQASTAVLDFGFFGGKYRSMSIDEALEECRAVIDQCKRYQGQFVFLYHNNQTTAPLWPFYNRLLDLACD